VAAAQHQRRVVQRRRLRLCGQRFDHRVLRVVDQHQDVRQLQFGPRRTATRGAMRSTMVPSVGRIRLLDVG
jgi:hypothetical protein